MRNRFRLGRQAMLGEYDTKVALGGWYYTATFDDLSEARPDGQPVRHHGSSGFYVLLDRILYKNPTTPDRKVSAFVQAGIGDNQVNRFGAYLGLGITAAGVIGNRSADELGLALAYAHNGSHSMSAQRAQGLPVTNAETAIELTYLIQVNSWLALQPDLQYVITPDTTRTMPTRSPFSCASRSCSRRTDPARCPSRRHAGDSTAPQRLRELEQRGGRFTSRATPTWKSIFVWR
jgi:porin